MKRSWTMVDVLLIVIVATFWQLSFSVAQDKVHDPGSPQDEGKTSGKNENGDLITVNCVGRIERQLDRELKPFYVVDLSGITFEGARNYRLNLKIVNPYEETIRFSHVSLTCGCAKFETEAKEFPALGAADFVMDVEVPNQTQMLLGRITASFFSLRGDLTPAVRMDVSYTLHGVFGFESDRAIIEIPQDESIVIAKLPIILVAPVTLEKLELKYSENIRDFNVRIVSDDPESAFPYVRLEVARKALPRHGMTGEVGLKRIGSDKVSGVIISFKHQEPFSIRPESLRLSRDNQSMPFKTVAMLRVREPKPDSTEGGQDESEKVVAVVPEVGLMVDNKPARVQVQPLGRSGLYRLTIQHDGPFEEGPDGKVDIRWKLIVNGEEHVIVSHAFLPDR
ncbi:MAG: hypothetical protein Q8M16_17300 [Pirellulaceae bacterium]|nr:hypothetical protein [Pirellulaceae bacterium]